MTQRAYNFAAGPAALPEPVLAQAQAEMMALPGPRASVMEISHRSATFKEIISAAEANIRKLLAVPDDYSVLFLQGGGRLQFSMIPMNLLGPQQGNSADYILTGSWGKHAAERGSKKHGDDESSAWDGSKAILEIRKHLATIELNLSPKAPTTPTTSATKPSKGFSSRRNPTLRTQRWCATRRATSCTSR